MAGNVTVRAMVGALLVVVTAGTAAGQKPVKPSDNYDELFARYLQEARRPAQGAPADGWAWMNRLAFDRRARQVNDLVTIRVIESITATGTADSSLSKASDASNAITKLFGLETKLPSIIDPMSLALGKTDNNFKGSGSTTRAGELTAVITARVADVLPNGDLVVEGVREIEINGDRQIVVLSGVVRVTDITPGNVVPSTLVGQLRIRYFGRGLIKDNLKPGWLIRVLNKIF